eukprot:TRINITY_DN14299_c0_g1_i1.p1 TRINITY_DN14299_c0_g1~~TRINITY_DN14299_c0_g1_i1.p1  ORF type:complete len:226 (+),score=44.49 TRINITY_DN14299_c0_g1_i1:70-678(+)
MAMVSSSARVPPRCCAVNSFDNVRVMRGQMTIRCRMCERKLRVQVERVKAWKCESFWSKGECENGDRCELLHLHFRKRNLKERVEVHGSQVLEPVIRAQGCPLKDPGVLALLTKMRKSPAESPAATPISSPRIAHKAHIMRRQQPAPYLNLEMSHGTPPHDASDHMYAVTPEAESDSESIVTASPRAFRYDPYSTLTNCVEV